MPRLAFCAADLERWVVYEENLVKDENLITYCGGYGGSCARWCGYTPFRELVTLVAEWVDAQGYQSLDAATNARV